LPALSKNFFLLRRRRESMKTNELSGAALDWAVARCEGIELEHGHYNRLLVDGRMSKGQSMLVMYLPSTDWAQGGPIIEREMIELEWSGSEWWARMWADEDFSGPTPLIAAMRCYVASKLGDEIELPEELGVTA
jgi:hypothetical protein